MNIVVDCDDTVIKFVDVWLELYNADYKDNLKKEDITDWDISRFTKPECGKKIYEYLNSKCVDIYFATEQIENSLNTINFLREIDHRVVFVTSLYHPSKYNWLLNNYYLQSPSDYIVAYDKSLINADLIIDDKFENVEYFPSGGILLLQPWNEKVIKENNENVDAIDKWGVGNLYMPLEELINDGYTIDDIVQLSLKTYAKDWYEIERLVEQSV